LRGGGLGALRARECWTRALRARVRSTNSAWRLLSSLATTQKAPLEARIALVDLEKLGGTE
jgi:hypothetical protein